MTMTSTNSAGLPMIGGNNWPNPTPPHIVTEAVEQRDMARDFAARLEAENHLMVDKIDTVRDYVQNLVGEWATNTVALDILTILDGPHDPTPYSGDFPTRAAYEAVNGVDE